MKGHTSQKIKTPLRAILFNESHHLGMASKGVIIELRGLFWGELEHIFRNQEQKRVSLVGTPTWRGIHG